MVRKIKPPPKRQLVEKYVDKKKSCEELGCYYQVHAETVRQWLIGYGISRRVSGPSLLDRERVVRLRQQGLPYKQIAALVGCSAGAA